MDRGGDSVLASIRNKWRELRRLTAKWIDPPPADDPAWDVPIGVSLQGAAALRDELGVDEDFYLRVAGQAWADPRAYVLYTALDEVKKAAMYLMRLREFLSGPPVSPQTDRMSRLMVTHLLEEQRARIRRLLEVLVLLILFESANEQDYFRHLLHLEGLDDLLSANSDLEEFYGARSANVDDSIAHQADWTRRVEQNLDPDRCWYAAFPKGLPDVSKLRPGRLLSSMRSRVRVAIPMMSDGERLLFGYSYAGMYGQTSESIHYSPKRDDYRLVDGEEYATAAGIGMLNLHILNRCHALMGARSRLSLIASETDSR